MTQINIWILSLSVLIFAQTSHGFADMESICRGWQRLVGIRLQMAMDNKEMVYKQFAGALELSTAHVSRITSGDSALPSLDEGLKAAHMLQVDLAWLMAEDYVRSNIARSDINPSHSHRDLNSTFLAVLIKVMATEELTQPPSTTNLRISESRFKNGIADLREAYAKWKETVRERIFDVYTREKENARWSSPRGSANRLTLAQLSTNTNISEFVLSRILKGEASIASYREGEALARFFGIEPRFLLGFDVLVDHVDMPLLLSGNRAVSGGLNAGFMQIAAIALNIMGYPTPNTPNSILGSAAEEHGREVGSLSQRMLCTQMFITESHELASSGPLVVDLRSVDTSILLQEIMRRIDQGIK